MCQNKTKNPHKIDCILTLFTTVILMWRNIIGVSVYNYFSQTIHVDYTLSKFDDFCLPLSCLYLKHNQTRSYLPWNSLIIGVYSLYKPHIGVL